MKPNVFVSSTCFDLSQVRRDIEETIERIGFNPILSDRNTFPVNPNEELITNCINNVSKNADILILIVGNRYGSKSESGKSITNIEYNTARQLGIPIYVFIKAEVINYLEIWKSNKDSDFSKQVDTKEIFSFVSQIREEDKVWSFEFTSAQDISATFIAQTAFKFKELLDINKHISNDEISSIWNHISSKAKNILLNQDVLYEIEFFIQVLHDELRKLDDLKILYEYKMLSTCSIRIDDNFELNKWLKIQSKSLYNFLNTFEILIDKLFPKYYGEPGLPSDKNGLLLIVQSYKKVLEEMLQWSLNVINVSVPDEAEELLKTFSLWLDNSIEKCLEFPNVLKTNIEDAKKRLNRGEKEISLEIVLKLEIDEEVSQKFHQMMAQLIL